MARQGEKAIDEIIGTGFNTAAQGYGLSAQELSSKALARIQKTLATLDTRARQEVEKQNYRLRVDKLVEFATLPAPMRERIVKVAKEKHNTIEQEYASDAARS